MDELSTSEEIELLELELRLLIRDLAKRDLHVRDRVERALRAVMYESARESAH